MDFVKGERSGTIYLVTQGESELQLWDFQAWLKGQYDAYIPISDICTAFFDVIGNLEANPELLPVECEGYNGEPHAHCVGIVYRNPEFNPEYAVSHVYEHSCGYPDDKTICICGKDQDDPIHKKRWTCAHCGHYLGIYDRSKDKTLCLGCRQYS